MGADTWNAPVSVHVAEVHLAAVLQCGAVSLRQDSRIVFAEMMQLLTMTSMLPAAMPAASRSSITPLVKVTLLLS
jgi:hypothetical protein